MKKLLTVIFVIVLSISIGCSPAFAAKAEASRTSVSMYYKMDNEDVHEIWKAKFAQLRSYGKTNWGQTNRGVQLICEKTADTVGGIVKGLLGVDITERLEGFGIDYSPELNNGDSYDVTCDYRVKIGTKFYSVSVKEKLDIRTYRMTKTNVYTIKEG